MTKKTTESKENIADNDRENASDTNLCNEPASENCQNSENERKDLKKSESELLQEKLCEERNNYIRLLADFDNFRKRMGEQVLKLRQEGIAYAIEVIFPVLDSMDRAINCVDDANKEGILLIKKQFDISLKTLGVEEIGEADMDFDPNIHHAVMCVENQEKSGKVVEVLQKGYKFKDNVIRCAMVKVAE